MSYPEGAACQTHADLHPDGQRFAVVKSFEEDLKRDKVVLVLNFFDEQRRLAYLLPGRSTHQLAHAQAFPLIQKA